MSCRTRNRKENEERKVNNGEQDNFFTNEMKEEMETMWEIPQIFHFLHLTKESLNIPQLSLYEMERMLLIPKASKQLANIMTCLLSSPTIKVKLRKVPPMPYEFWTNILAYKTTSWFKIYRIKHKDATKVLETIGVEPEFWNIFPETSMLDGKDFEDLSFKQRVWLLKTVCDTIMHTRKTVQEDIINQPWKNQFETVLGTDRNGARYIYFPQFIPNDFRIYRHSLDNKILSSVKPVRQERATERNKFIKHRKRDLQIHDLIDSRSNECEERNDDKDLSNNDSATCSFISDDTNLSSASTYSDNNINLHTVSRKRRRSLSKMSEESLLSNARSSGYDTNTSNDNKSIDDESLQMFKGFSNTQNDNYNMGVINKMLEDLKRKIDKKSEHESNSDDELALQENFIELYKNITVSHNKALLIVEKDENEKSDDNLSNSSKTDDEKLNEIINADNSKLPENIYSKSISISDNVSDISTLTSKSDDEKLNETTTTNSNNDISASKNNLSRKTTFNKLFDSSCSLDNISLSEEIAGEYLDASEIKSIEADSNNPIEKEKFRSGMKLRSRNIIKQRNKESKTEITQYEINKRQRSQNDKTNETGEEHFTANKTRLQINMEYNLDNYTNTTDADYNLQKFEELKTDEYKRRFNKMLSDLSVSNFYLVADNLEGLRNLIASFSSNDSKNNNSNTVEVIPLCEVKLIKKLTELLNSMEPLEVTIKDAMRKAKAKLQREWSNFKEGSVEDQESSSEGGLSSNWWVLGSQGKDPPFSTATGDATLQTLSQSALSPLSIQKQSQNEDKRENSAKNSEQSHHERQETSDYQENGSDKKQPNVETLSGKTQKEEKKEHGKNGNASNDKEQKSQHSRRVLRTRGISSYTEQFYSDDESDENELEEWTDVEAVYAAPGTQASTSTSYVDSKDRNTDNWSEKEDSDQDWILPSSRKRKNKRSLANRRLKSFQYKVQNIKENASQNNVTSEISHSVNIKSVKDKLKIKLRDNELKEVKKTTNLQVLDGNITKSATCNKNSKRAVPSKNIICETAFMNSVHSELDIKDENPAYETTPTNNYEQNTYVSVNSQQNYYYVTPPNIGTVQQRAIVQEVVPQYSHMTYYVQPNTYLQTPKFLPGVQQQQQIVYQQQSPQMIIAQPCINNTSYVPYVTSTTQPQTEYVIAPGPMTNQPNPQNFVYHTPKPQNRYNQNNKSATPRLQNLRPKDAATKSNSTPVRKLSQKPANSKAVKSNVSQSVPRLRRKSSHTSNAENSGQKVTSLIMLSDSDDEIEMIIMEKTPTTEKTTPADKVESSESQGVTNQPKQKPTITSDITVPSTKGILSPQIIQRMSQGGISITPVKNNPPPTNSNTQLVVVLNETGSHYALALPNGSKLILTPEQVAQIRASNGGKLIL
ncbi:hypothetical protein PUN28_002641 [Cardiocondyla obscurior]|uniref:Uncharacterized bromodomain-containing protein 10 helical domain-containing protein n=1 Tax=Cardiocondyla obscurior TaxID=286306 RepID=A0AAW2GVA9_9HYME